MQQPFRPGDRVRVTNAEYPEFWANGVTGQVGAPPEAVVSLADGWSGHVRLVQTVRGVEPYYWVVLDEPRLDDDGDGPYGEAELAGSWLQVLK